MSLQEIYIKILESNIINFIIMVSILTFIFKKFKLGTIIDNFANDIQSKVTTSFDAVQNALKEYKEKRKEQREIPNKKEKIINDAKLMAKKLEDKNKEDILKKEIELDKSYEKVQNSLHRRSVEKTAQDIQAAVLNLTKDTIKNMMTEEMQVKSIFMALDEFDKLEGVIKWKN